MQTDVTNQEDVIRCIQAVQERFGQLDAVIGCAGISRPVGTSAMDVTAEDWDHVMALNVPKE